jgi:hypothetical protein
MVVKGLASGKLIAYQGVLKVSLTRTTFWLMLAVLVLTLLPRGARADVWYDLTKTDAWQSGLLYNHFGVQLKLLDQPKTYTFGDDTWSYYGFDLASFKPTKNTQTADFYVEDWWGAWDVKGRTKYYNTHPNFRTDPTNGFNPDDPDTYANGWPYGGEIYDAEAIYFDNDADNLYIAVVTSYDPPPGRVETNWGWSGGLQGFSGDLALEIPAQEKDQPFAYRFGVNWNDETRNSNGTADKGSPPYWDCGVYDTTDNDMTNNSQYWYNPVGGNVANPKPSNFDPNFAVNGSKPTKLGDAEVHFYKWFFWDAAGKELLENQYSTYVYEAKIPRSFFANYGLDDGTKLRIHWGMSCGNDYGESFGSLDATMGSPPVTPELSTLVLLCATAVAGGLLRLGSSRARKSDG